MICKLTLVLSASWCCLLPWPMLAQTNPPPPAISIAPPDGAILITETTNSIFVTIANFDAFTNITVTGSFVTQPNFSFLDDGQVIETTQSWYRGDAYDFVAELNARA